VREYETTLIIQPEISDEGVGALQERLDGILEGFGASRLIYDRYVMLRFLDDGSNIKGLERALGLEDSIIRFLTVQVDEAVEDVAARRAEAAEEVRIRAEKAAERAAREAEEAARQQAEAAEAEKLAAAEKETADRLAADEREAAGDEEPEATTEDAEPSAPVAAPNEGETTEAASAEEVVT
jgi:ribosomal protein S6